MPLDAHAVRHHAGSHEPQDNTQQALIANAPGQTGHENAVVDLSAQAARRAVARSAMSKKLLQVETSANGSGQSARRGLAPPNQRHASHTTTNLQPLGWRFGQDRLRELEVIANHKLWSVGNRAVQEFWIVAEFV
jgi:hypothetical protein